MCDWDFDTRLNFTLSHLTFQDGTGAVCAERVRTYLHIHKAENLASGESKACTLTRPCDSNESGDETMRCDLFSWRISHSETVRRERKAIHSCQPLMLSPHLRPLHVPSATYKVAHLTT